MFLVGLIVFVCVRGGGGDCLCALPLDGGEIVFYRGFYRDHLLGLKSVLEIDNALQTKHISSFVDLIFISSNDIEAEY